MKKTTPFLLRKIAGTFDACLPGKPGGLVERAPISVAGFCGAFMAVLLLPLLILGAIAGALAAVTAATHGAPHLALHVATLSHVGHVSHVGHLAPMSLAGLAIGETKTVEIKDVHDTLQNLTKQFREANEASLAEVKKYGTETAETKAALAKIQAAMDQLEVKMQRSLNVARHTPLNEEPISEKEEKTLKAFNKWVKSGTQTAEAEYKSLSTDSNPDGGYLVPNVMSNRIINKLIQFSNVRALVTVETITTGDSLDIPAEGAQNFAAGWTGERAARVETAAGQVRMEKIPAHEMYAKPLVSQTQLDDSAFDVESWASDRVARRLAVIEGAAFVNGSGVTQPEGFMSNASVGQIVTGSAAALTVDGMFDLMAAIPTPYAQNATIVGNRKTKYALRKLKDTQNRYLWEPSLQAGTPAAFDQTPFVELVDMPDVAASAFPIAAGDFRSAYTIVDRQGIRLVRDPFTSKPFVELYFTKRTGGQVVLAEAFRILQCHT